MQYNPLSLVHCLKPCVYTFSSAQSLLIMDLMFQFAACDVPVFCSNNWELEFSYLSCTVVAKCLLLALFKVQPWQASYLPASPGNLGHHCLIHIAAPVQVDHSHFTSICMRRS